MGKVIDYTLVEIRDSKVKDKLDEGWQPWGSAINDGVDGYAYQPMVKYEDETIKALGDTEVMQASYDRREKVERLMDKRIKEYEQYWNEEEQKYFIPGGNGFEKDEFTKDELYEDIRKGAELEVE